ncbi:MAG: hypothetical protein WBP03_05535 [Candidatus Saccharimonadales bacterium]
MAHCSPEENSDLFYETAGSYGTLGVITAAEIMLIPAKKYVALTPIPVSSFSEAISVSRRHATNDYDFVECGMLSPDKGVIIVGRLTDAAVGTVLRVRRPFDTWYYIFTKKVAHQKTPKRASCRSKITCFGLTEARFGVGKATIERCSLPFNVLTLLALDPWLRTRKLYHRRTRKLSRPTIHVPRSHGTRQKRRRPPRIYG